VDRDAVAFPAAPLIWDRDVHIYVNTGWGRRAATPQHAPELARAGVAEQRVIAASEYRRHPPAFATKPLVTHREDTAMNAMKTPRLDSAQATPLANAGRIELGNGYDAMLARSQPSNRDVRVAVGALPTHAGG
jgi:hypothetical protein